MNWGTGVAFLLTALMVAAVIVFGPAANRLVSQNDTPAPVSAPSAQTAGEPAPVASAAVAVPSPPAGQTTAAHAGPPVVVAATTAPAPAKPAASLIETLRSRGLGCVLAGFTGTGLTAAIGPGEIAALAVGATLLPATPALIGATLGTVFLTGCAVGAAVTPLIKG